MEKLSWIIRKGILCRCASVLLFVGGFSYFNVQAQTTNLLNLCTEEALRAAVGIGGIYQVDCGSNIATISLNEPLVITRDLTLYSTQQVLLDGQSLTRLIVVNPGVKFTLRNFLLFSGSQTETNLNDGGVPDTAGAGIYNDHGVVTVLDGMFQANSVVGVTGLSPADSSDGEPGGDGAGGAIYNNGGQLILSNVVFEANTVTAGPAGGGGTNSFGDGGNGGNGGSGAGAAIYSNGGSVQISACYFTNNTASGTQGAAGGFGGGLVGFPGEPGQAGDAVGAAVASASADLAIYASTFVSNRVTAANGLAGNNGVFGREGEQGKGGGAGAGAAIYSTGQLWMTNCTLFGNSAVGGTGGAGGAADTGLFGEDGGQGGNGGMATGGALESTGNALVVNCTFSDNVVTAGQPGAGGAATGIGDNGSAGSVGVATGGAIYGRSGQVLVANSLLLNSKVTVAGNVSDRGGNLSTDLNPLLTSPSSLRLTNPFILPLSLNGGPTPTMALLTNSPAINHGVGDFCPPLDQRGSNRVDTCDMGAYESIVGQTNIALPPIPTNILNSFTFTRATNEVVLQWPTGYTNLSLQLTTNFLGTNTVWSTVTSRTSTNNGSNVLAVSTSNPLRPVAFFRLFGLTNLALTNSMTTVTTDTNTVIPPVPGT